MIVGAYSPFVVITYFDNSLRLTESSREYELPSGKLIYIGTGYFERYDGQTYEWLGIPPDIRVEQTEADILNGRDKQLEYAIDMLK